MELYIPVNFPDVIILQFRWPRKRSKYSQVWFPGGKRPSLIILSGEKNNLDLQVYSCLDLQTMASTESLPMTIWLVVWTPLKNISQLGWLSPIYGKIKNVSKPPTSHFFHVQNVYFMGHLPAGSNDCWSNLPTVIALSAHVLLLTGKKRLVGRLMQK